MGVAALAYAYFLLFDTLVAALATAKWMDVVQVLGLAEAPWVTAALASAVLSSVVRVVGFVIVGAAFLGEQHSRAARLRLGAYLAGISYLVTLLIAIAASTSHDVTYVLDWLAFPIWLKAPVYATGASAALVLGSAYVRHRVDVVTAAERLRRLLGWGAACVAAHVLFYGASVVLEDFLYHPIPVIALDLVAYLALLVAALAGSFALLGRDRRVDEVRTMRRARVVRIAAVTVAVFGVTTLARALVSTVPYVASDFDYGLALVRDGGLVVAAVCLALALAGVYWGMAPLLRAPVPDEKSVAKAACPSCGAPYASADYREEAEVWLCMSCGANLRLV